MFSDKERDTIDTDRSRNSDLQSDATNTTGEVQAPVPMMSTDMADQLALYTRIMVTFCIVSECSLSFVCFSLDLFALHGLAQFCTDYSCEYTINGQSYAKFTAAIIALCLGLVFDSYWRDVKYYVILASIVLLVVWPCLHFVIAFPMYWPNEEKREKLVAWVLLFHGLPVVFHQIRIALILERALDDHKLPHPRRFVGLLVFAQHLGQFLAGLAIWVCQSSRVMYSTLMCLDIVLCLLYVLFWFFWSRGFTTEEGSPYACVERTLMNIICYTAKIIDHKLCRGLAFQNRPGWQDFRCLRFSERTAYNTWAFLCMLLVLLPLVGYFVTDTGLNYLYICQSSNRLPVEGETFSVLALKGCYFCILYPFFEFVVFPCGTKLVRNNIIQLLFSIGVGAFLLGVVVAICAVIQQGTSAVEQDVVNVLSAKGRGSFAHVVIMNLLPTEVKIRGEYFNRILVKNPNAWRTVKPFEIYKVLNIPISNLPFNLSVYSEVFRIYDDYSFALEEYRFNWLCIHPLGMFVLPVGTFHQDPQIGVNPEMFEPAYVNVLCRIPVCKGVLEFRRKGQYRVRAFFPDDKDEDLGLKLRTFKMAGEYEVGFSLVGNHSSEIASNMTFHWLRVYLLVIKLNAINEYQVSGGKTEVLLVKASRVKDTRGSIWILYLPTLFHALAAIFGEIALLQWLHIVCPHDLRCFIFSIPTFLSLITYCYFMKMGVTSLTTIGSINIFSYACSCWILLIIYGVACLHFVHVWNKRHMLHHQGKKHKKTKHRGHTGPSPDSGNAEEGLSHAKDKKS